MTKCSEKLYGTTISGPCPNESVGRFTDWDGYENRSYPMCAYHARLNDGEVSDNAFIRDKKKCEEYLQTKKLKRTIESLKQLGAKELK